jgi:transposase-like protein
MPWRETWSAEERLEFVQDWNAGAMSVASLCRSYGVSRRTGYKWLKRYSREQGLESLRDRSSKPRSNSRAVSTVLEDSIVAARKLNPTYGPRKLRAMLETANPPEATLAAQQRSFDRFRKRYNEDRPHEALGQIPPSRAYEPSSRPFPGDGWRPPDPEYGFFFEAHRVDEHGNLRWRGRSVYLSIALAHELVGLRHAPEDIWEVFFGPVQLGTIKAPQRKKDVVRLVRPATVLPMSSV